MPTSKPRKQDRAITFLTQEEMQRLFSVIKDKRDRAIFAVAYRHGLRASEVDMLRLTDVDSKDAPEFVNVKSGQGLQKKFVFGTNRPLDCIPQ